MKAEPKIPKNGLCIVCKKPLVPIKRYGAGAEDAFCSTVCCKTYFGVPTTTFEEGVGGVKRPSP